jgi:hypothetical protein
MSLLRHITRGLRGLFMQSSKDTEIAAEVAHYFDESVAAGLARGLTRDEVERAAKAEIGTRLRYGNTCAPMDGRTRFVHG